jgi:chemotaxis signal transduction protein
VKAESSSIDEQVAELRHAFDSSFAEAPPEKGAELEDMLAIRVENNAYALRLAEISGLVRGTTPTRLADQAPMLLGVASVRGAIVSVYDLGVLLGHGRGGSRRWLVLTAADATVGLSFDEFEGHLQVPVNKDVVRVADTTRPIVPISSLVEQIEREVRGYTEQEER